MEPGFKRDIVRGACSYFSPARPGITSGLQSRSLKRVVPRHARTAATCDRAGPAFGVCARGIKRGPSAELAFGRLSWVAFTEPSEGILIK